LLFTAGVLADQSVGDAGEAGALEDLRDGTRFAVERGGHLQRLSDRQVLERAAGLHDGGDPALGDGVPRAPPNTCTRPAVGRLRPSKCRSSTSCIVT
jgi:hypothetical protein